VERYSGVIYRRGEIYRHRHRAFDTACTVTWGPVSIQRSRPSREADAQQPPLGLPILTTRSPLAWIQPHSGRAVLYLRYRRRSPNIPLTSIPERADEAAPWARGGVTALG
jgi:hypothetical protein